MLICNPPSWAHCNGRRCDWGCRRGNPASVTLLPKCHRRACIQRERGWLICPEHGDNFCISIANHGILDGIVSPPGVHRCTAIPTDSPGHHSRRRAGAWGWPHTTPSGSHGRRSRQSQVLVAGVSGRSKSARLWWGHSIDSSCTPRLRRRGTVSLLSGRLRLVSAKSARDDGADRGPGARPQGHGRSLDRGGSGPGPSKEKRSTR
mmetsp:Transcript_68660/g.150051  ORF Transcript_68660/g.150051 Transcript_68660/m.150051 type:complete len:205 (-) Transcript_68660:129-743(-)